MGAPPSADGTSEDDDSRIRVYFRLRPMNNLEKSRRSKDCVELHDDPKILTVDAPLQGEYDFSCDMVFDEGASQDEVYHEAISGIPRRLMRGMNCAVVAYGQTGTGKTHTMIGEGLGAELNAKTRHLRNQPYNENGNESRSSDNSNNNDNDDGTLETTHGSNERTAGAGIAAHKESDPSRSEGIVPRAVADMFDLIRQEPKSVEYVVRCSFVEIYLEKIVDLLNPASTEAIGIHRDSEGFTNVYGASEVCCVKPMDVICLLARGNAHRTQSSTNQNADSSRSHGLVTLRVDRTDTATGQHRTSRLQMLDLAGSELARTKSSRQIESAVMAEGKMINQSLACLSNMIRATLANQGKDRAAVHPDKYANASKLAKLLQPSFGGNMFTTIICTASPSSYNIGETINTVRFAQRVQRIRNSPKICENLTVHACRQKLAASQNNVDGLSTLVKVLAKECNKFAKANSAAGVHITSKTVSNIVDQLAELSQDDETDVGDGIDIIIKPKHGTTQHGGGDGNDDDDGQGDGNDFVPAANEFSERARREIESANQARDRAENTTRDIMSELTALRSQNEILLKEKEKLENEMSDTKTEMRSLTSRMAETEHNLRTSQFRENEATTFLRLFRSFYLRLLKHKAAQGNNDTSAIYAEEMNRKIPGVPELEDLIDIDTLMMASGLIEEDEVGQDANAPDYVPSNDALSRSGAEAEQAKQRETELVEAMNSSDKHAESNGASSGELLSAVHRAEPAQLTSYRQKLVQSPAGLLAMKKEKELERELLDLSSKCINLQNAVNAEKAMVEAMSSRQGALGKIKTAQEMNTLRQELERKSNDLQAIVLKMNELHLVNKTFDEKVEARERHASYLEEHLSDLQSRNRRLVIERQEAEKRLREENLHLKNLLDGYSVRVWQMDASEGGASDIDQKLRLLVPFNGPTLSEQQQDEGKAERRYSIEQALEDIAMPEMAELVSASAQTDESNLNREKVEWIETSIQTDPPPEGVDSEVQTEAPEQQDTSIQTETVATSDFSLQTETVAMSDFSLQTDAVALADTSAQTSDVVLADFSIQTDDIPSQSISCQTNTIEFRAVEAQTDEPPEPRDVHIQTDEILSPETNDCSAQTNDQPTMNEVCIQTEITGEISEGQPAHSAPPDDANVEAAQEEEQEDTATKQQQEARKQTEMVEMAIQTETEQGIDQAMQTEEKEEATAAVAEAPVITVEFGAQTDEEVVDAPAATVEFGAQTDKSGELQAVPNIETATVATQTDLEETEEEGEEKANAHANTKEEKPPCSEIAIQTDELPYVIDVAGSRSVDTGSLADSDHHPHPTTSKAAQQSRYSHSHEANFEGSMTSIGDRWKQPRHSAMSHNTKSGDESDDSLTIPSITQLKGKFSKMANNSSADTYAKANSSMSSFGKLTPVSSKYSDGPSHKELVTLSRASVARPPLSQGIHHPAHATAAAVSGVGGVSVRRRSAKDGADTSGVPEWMSKRKEMGLQPDDGVKNPARAAAGKAHVRKNSMEFGSPSQLGLSPRRSPKPVIKPSMGGGSQVEWMQKLKQMGKKVDDDSTSTASSVHESKSPVPPPKSPVSKQQQGSQLEWMERFKQIGMKGEETVIEASGTIPSTRQHDDDDDDGLVADDGQPEWKKRYKQIGQKGVEEVVIVEKAHRGRASGFDPQRFAGEGHDEEELERIRKEEKRARKKERKAMKKAKKAQERMQAEY